MAGRAGGLGPKRTVTGAAWTRRTGAWKSARETGGDRRREEVG